MKSIKYRIKVSISTTDLLAAHALAFDLPRSRLLIQSLRVSRFYDVQRGIDIDFYEGDATFRMKFANRLSVLSIRRDESCYAYARRVGKELGDLYSNSEFSA